MQEVTIRPRSAFRHFVTVDTSGKELCWNFCTRKKNLSFGLFRKIDSALVETPNVTVVSGSEVGRNVLVVSDSQRSSLVNPEVDSPSLRRKHSQEDMNMIPIMPIAHYESSKITIKGSYFIQEPGTYVLVFDNRFSVNTSKKLFFFVALRDPNPRLSTTITSSEEGWMLKKGKRAMQGFQPRWVQVLSSGFLQYYKHPGSGSIDLKSCAIRLDHDHRLIDIDSGQSIFHFKVEDPDAFEKWTSAIEPFASSLDGAELDPLNASSTSILETELEDICGGMDTLNSSSITDLARIKEHVDAWKSKIENRKSMHAETASLIAIQEVISNVLSNNARLERKLKQLSSSIKSQKDKAFAAIQQSELAFFACLNDNNRIRRKYGLQSVNMASFLPPGASLMSISGRERMDSISSTKHSEMFYDAEQPDSEEYYSEEEEEEVKDVVQTQPSLDSIEDTPVVAKKTEFSRRTKLPAPTASMQNVSIMSILRNNVGKDLSTVTMPILLNEPINLLQKLCEELQYSELLDAANQATNCVDRMCLIAAFVVSGYSSSIYRAARKPFNPLLGETYELDRPDKGFKFVSEKVSHQPPIMACHASSLNFTYYQDSLLKTKFWGKSMELNNIGTTHVILNASNEHYTWNKVTTSMRNIFSNSRYLEHYGVCKITCSNGYECELQFKESGYFSPSKNEVTGGVYLKGEKLISLNGQWDHSLCKCHVDSPDSLQVIWRCAPFPTNYQDNYGFTQFAIELNELNADLKPLLPNTDTRFRPDQRLYEQGHVDEAELEKGRLEQKQREYRKSLEAAGKKWIPKWFTLESDDYSQSGQAWKYSGKYWETRGKFVSSIDLFS